MLRDDQINQEKVIMGLRLAEGIDRRLIANNSKLSEFIAAGFIENQHGNICATRQGRLILNKLILDLLT